MGRGRRLKIPRGVSYHEAMKKAGGRELFYAYYRCGHWRKQRCGKKYLDAKVIWVDLTVVRPDLDFKRAI